VNLTYPTNGGVESMAIDGVSGPITPATFSGGRTDKPSVLLENEEGVIGTVDARNEERIEHAALAQNISVSQPTEASPATGGEGSLSADAAIIAQAAGETSTGSTTASNTGSSVGLTSGSTVEAFVGVSAGTPEARALGSAVDIVI
jgi:hypothetical protein